MSTKRNMPKKSFTCTTELWDRLTMAAAMRSVEEGRSVSISELLRRGARREVAMAEQAANGAGEYEMPEEIDG